MSFCVTASPTDTPSVENDFSRISRWAGFLRIPALKIWFCLTFIVTSPADDQSGHAYTLHAHLTLCQMVLTKSGRPVTRDWAVPRAGPRVGQVGGGGAESRNSLFRLSETNACFFRPEKLASFHLVYCWKQTHKTNLLKLEITIIVTLLMKLIQRVSSAMFPEWPLADNKFETRQILWDKFCFLFVCFFL